MAEFPSDRWVTANGLRLHYRDWGGSGQPMVLLHGLASTCHIWDLVAPILRNSFAVVALDQRGHGESDKPQTGYDFATLAADLHGFVRALGLERPLIVGHSWGGDVALEYAAEYPTKPIGLCLVDGGIIEISAQPDMTLERAKEEMAPPDFTGLTLEQLKELGSSRDWGFELTPEIEEALLANFEVQPDGTILARLSRENHFQVIEAFWQHKPSTLYPRVRCPVLLMPTRRHEVDSDQEKRRADVKGRWVEAANRLLPVSRTVWMEDSVHDVPVQRPELVARTIEEHVNGRLFGGAG